MAGAKAAAEPASRVAMASFIMVAGYYFATEEERRDDGRGSGRQQQGGRRRRLGFCVCRWLNMYL